MREKDDEIGHYLGLLRRIIILFAVIIAVPVILWTITAFIVGLPKVSNFHSPLATASINAGPPLRTRAGLSSDRVMVPWGPMVPARPCLIVWERSSHPRRARVRTPFRHRSKNSGSFCPQQK